MLFQASDRSFCKQSPVPMFCDRMSEEELTLNGEQTDLKKYVEDVGGIHGLREVHKVRGWNNIQYGAGLSAKNTPSTKLSMNKAFIPPGGIAKAHIHVDFDVMVFLL